MTANELSKRFLIWFQKNNPEAKIYRNNRGCYKTEAGNWIKYGIPTPAGSANKDKLKGSDYIAFMRDYDFYGFTAKFYEIKTAKDTLKPGQINFMNLMTGMGADCFIVHELNDWKIFQDGIKEKTPYNTDKNCHYGFYIEKWSVK